MVKEVGPYCWTKFGVMEVKQAFLTVLETQLVFITVSIVKMLVSHAHHVSVKNVIVQSTVIANCAC